MNAVVNELLTDSDILEAERKFSLSEINGDLKVFNLEHDDSDCHIYGLTNVVYSGRTEHQRVLIADSFQYGRVLVLDGEIQSSAADEELYHELLVQPSMVLHPNPRRVLIIGSGEGASLREVLRHKSVETVTLVDFDAKIIELSQEHLQSWHRGSFSDPRVKVVNSDGRKFVSEDASKYDVIIVDVIDLDKDGPSRSLYTKEFYQLLKARLAPGGVTAVQAMKFSHLDSEAHCLLARTMRTIFTEVHSYHAIIPSFLCDWSFILASDWFNPKKMSAKNFNDTISARIGADVLKHIDGDFFISTLQFPKNSRAALAENGPVLQDAS
jgi:spermidine synthase